MGRASFLAMGTLLIGLGIGYFAAIATRPRPEMRTARPADTRAADLAAIEKLHRADVEATLTQDPSYLTKLWSDDGVNLGFAGPPVVGINAMKEAYEKFWAEHPDFKVLKYAPEIKDVQIADGWAIEVGYFEGTYKLSVKDNPVTTKGDGMRVLKRQSDGSWKFALVGLK